MSTPTTGYTIGGAASGTATAPLPVLNSQASLTADYIPLYSASLGGTAAATIATLLGVGSQVVSVNDPMTLTQKTVVDNSFTFQNSSSSTKKAQFLLSSITAGNTRIFTLPDYNGTVATLGGTETFTNKTLTSPAITGGTIDNAAITVDSISGHTASTTVAVAGLTINNGVLGTNNSVVTANITAKNVTAAKLKNGLISNRQGGTTGNASWFSQGSSNTDTSAIDVFIQVGSIDITADAQSITFPVAYSQIPVVILTAIGLTNKCYALINTVSTSQVNVSIVTSAGAFSHADGLTWMAIGQ